jgi:hypothetical protein
MPIDIPLHLNNKTGPEWQKFVADAKKAGIEVKNVGKAADDVVKNLKGKQVKEYADNINGLAKAYGGAATSAQRLTNLARIGTAYNLVPFGTERPILRAAQAMDQLATLSPRALAGVGAVGAAVAAVAATVLVARDSFRIMYADGDQRAREIASSWFAVGSSIRIARENMGRFIATTDAGKAAGNWWDGMAKGMNAVLTDEAPAAGKVLGARNAHDSAKGEFEDMKLVEPNNPRLLMLEAQVRRTQNALNDALKELADIQNTNKQKRIDFLKNPVTESDKPLFEIPSEQLEATLRKHMREIDRIKTLNDLTQKRADLEKEVQVVMAKGDMSAEHQSFVRAKLVALAEKERDLLKEQADLLLKAQAEIRSQIAGRGKLLQSDPRGQALAGKIQPGSEDEVLRQVAEQRARDMRGQVADSGHRYPGRRSIGGSAGPTAAGRNLRPGRL